MAETAIYTELDSHRASLRERLQVVRLVWITAGEPDIAPRARRKIRRITVAHYLRPSARVSSYLVSWGNE